MSVAKPPSPLGSSWKIWGETLNTFLTRTRDKLNYKTSADVASEDGVMMWDATQGCPVVSKNGAWVRIQLDP